MLISFRFYGEPGGIQKWYFSEFKRLDKFFVENSTLPVADSELVMDIFQILCQHKQKSSGSEKHWHL